MKRWDRAWLLFGLAALLALPASAKAQPVTLMVTSMSPGGSTHTAQFHKWADEIAADSGGALKLDIRDGYTLANFGNIYERVTSDVVQVGWMALANIGGRFPLSTVANLPMLGDSGERVAVVIEKIYGSGLLDAEYKDIVPLWLFATSPSVVHCADTPKTLNDLKGLRIMTFSKEQADFVRNLGGQALSLEMSQSYEALQRGTADCLITGWSNPLKFQEVTFSHIEAPLGTTTHAIFMSRAKFNALPEAAKTVLERHSGEAMSRRFGAYFDWFAAEQRSKSIANGKHKVIQLTPEQEAIWTKAAEPIFAEWVQNKAGGEKVLSTFRSLLPQVSVQKN